MLQLGLFGDDIEVPNQTEDDYVTGLEDSLTEDIVHDYVLCHDSDFANDFIIELKRRNVSIPVINGIRKTGTGMLHTHIDYVHNGIENTLTY